MLGEGEGIRLNVTAARERLRELGGSIGLDVDPGATTGLLALGQQQQLEIIKALWRGSKVLILDEPTSMLTPQGVAELEQIVARLKQQGLAVIFITHKLHEAISIGDRVSVLSQGRLVGAIEPDELRSATHEELQERIIALMAYPRVLAAQGKQITYHYDPAFLEAFRRTERKVAEIFLTDNDVLLMQGEAVLGLEAAARGLVMPGTHVLNLVSGIFGKGMGYWLKDFGAELHELDVPYNDSVDPADVERYLGEHPEIDLLTVVHSETPSGTLHEAYATPYDRRRVDSRTISSGGRRRWVGGNSRRSRLAWIA